MKPIKRGWTRRSKFARRAAKRRRREERAAARRHWRLDEALEAAAAAAGDPELQAAKHSWLRRKSAREMAGLLRTEASWARLAALEPTPPAKVVEAGLVEYDGADWKPAR